MKNKYIYIGFICLYFLCYAFSALVVGVYESHYIAPAQGIDEKLTITEQISFFMLRYFLQFPIWFPNWFSEGKEGFSIFFFLPNSIIIAKITIILINITKKNNKF